MKKKEILEIFRGGNFMSLSLRERRAVVKEISMRYKKLSKKEKSKMLDEFVNLTEYSRCYASYALRMYEKKVVVYLKGVRTVFVADNGYRGRKDKRNRELRMKRKRKRIYDESVLNALIYLWRMSDYICGKRLKAYIEEALPNLKKFRGINIDQETEEKLLKISPATIDRLLRKEKMKYRVKKGKSWTKPGTLLKHQIAIRTFADWDEKIPGFVEVDLVGHEGGILRGDFLYTLDVTDVPTGWTETKAIRNKAQVWVFNALKEIRKRLPVELLGIDSDNGSEFINVHLLNYCEREHITFTRSRPYRKNDNCFVEQKNYSVVRRAVGYLRYDTEEELKIMNEMYNVLRVYTNFFLPSMKLIEKTRIGSKVTKKYDKPKTPYRRIIESEYVPEETKEKLRDEYNELNPALLKRKLDKLQRKLSKAYDIKQRKKELSPNIPNISPLKDSNLVYNFSEAIK